jgi:hypothetical protein
MNNLDTIVALAKRRGREVGTPDPIPLADWEISADCRRSVFLADSPMPNCR